MTHEIRLKDCRIQYTPFPYPLQHVQGLVTALDSRWTLNDIEARGINDSTVVKCRGEAITHDSGCEADLTFEATNVPLDDNLKQALSSKPAAQQAWNELQPQGNIDFTAHVTRQPNELEPNVEVTLRPRENTVSIEPRMFPYRLEQVEGAGHLQARPGRAEEHRCPSRSSGLRGGIGHVASHARRRLAIQLIEG